MTGTRTTLPADPGHDVDRWSRIRGACCDIAPPGFDVDLHAGYVLAEVERVASPLRQDAPENFTDTTDKM